MCIQGQAISNGIKNLVILTPGHPAAYCLKKKFFFPTLCGGTRSISFIQFKFLICISHFCIIKSENFHKMNLSRNNAEF